MQVLRLPVFMWQWEAVTAVCHSGGTDPQHTGDPGRAQRTANFLRKAPVREMTPNICSVLDFYFYFGPQFHKSMVLGGLWCCSILAQLHTPYYLNPSLFSVKPPLLGQPACYNIVVSLSLVPEEVRHASRNADSASSPSLPLNPLPKNRGLGTQPGKNKHIVPKWSCKKSLGVQGKAPGTLLLHAHFRG